MLLEAEMAYMCNSQSSAAHKTITRRASPTGFDGQASYSVAEVGFDTDHVSAKGSKIMRFLFFDLYWNIVPVRVCREFGECCDEPVDCAALISSFEAFKAIKSATIFRSDGAPSPTGPATNSDQKLLISATRRE